MDGLRYLPDLRYLWRIGAASPQKPQALDNPLAVLGG